MTEEERIAEEQASLAAAPISRPEPVWAGSAPADIEFANATEPRMRSYAEAGMPAASFINADVAPTGEVISGSYDSTLDDLRNLKAQEAAQRYKGQQLYQSLISGGATPAEAYRASAHLINYAHPETTLKMEALMQKRAPVVNPSIMNATPVKDAAGNVIGHAVFDPITGKIHKTFDVSRKPEPVAIRTEKVLKDQMDESRKQIGRDMRAYQSADDEQRTEIARRITAERTRLQKLEQDYQKGGAALAPAPVPAGTPAIAPPPTWGTEFIQRSPEGFVDIGNPDRPAAAVTTPNPAGGFTISKPQAIAAPAKNEVRRMVGNRTAVFDAATKKFLRYEN